MHQIEKRPISGPRALIQGGLALASLLVLGLLFYGSLGELAAYPWRVQPLWLGAAFVSYSLALALAAVGWHLIARELGASVGFWQDVRFYTLSNPPRRLPGRIWGFASRLYLYRGAGVSSLRASLALGVETAMTAFGGVLALLPLSLVVPPLSSWVNPWLVGGLSGLAVLALALWPLLGRRLAPLAGDPQSQGGRPGPTPQTLLLWLVDYLLLWLLGGLVLYTFGQSLYPFPWEALPSLLGIWVLSGLVGLVSLVVPVAFGLTEASLAYLLSFQTPGALAVLLALGLRVFLTLAEVLWMLVALAAGRRARP